MEEMPKTVRDEADLLSALSGAPPVGSVWKHAKTGNDYVVTARGIREEDLSPMLAYRRVDGSLTWFRPVSEFLDGRFQRVL